MRQNSTIPPQTFFKPTFLTLAIAGLLIFLSADWAVAQDRFFNQTNSGDFALAANWQEANPPSTGFANTFVGSSDLGSPTLAPVTAFLASDVSSWETGRLFLGQGGSGNATLIIYNGGSLQYGEVYIGRDAAAVGVVNQLGGTNRVNTGTFEILSGSSSTGTYNLSGGVLNTVQAGAIAIKVGAFGAGTGYFNMSGGTLNAGSDFATQQHSLNVGWESKGEATFSGGTANITGDLNAGNNGNGLVTISDSATVNARNLNVGLQAGGANSRLTVSGGTVSVTNGISVANSSTLNIGGGTVTAAGIGIAAGSAMTDIGGTLNVPAVTNNGSLVFSNTAGTLTRTATISGGGTVTKTGAGSVTLTGANAYTGGTTVSDGELVIAQAAFTATITPSAISVTLSNTPSVGDNFQLVPGSLDGSYGPPSVTPLGAGQSASFNASTGLLSITQSASGPTFTDAYPGNAMNDLAPNGQTFLVNYALGGDSSTPATLPWQDTSDPTKLTLVAYVRTNNPVGTTLLVEGQKSDSLTNFDVADPVPGVAAGDQSDAPAGTEKRVFSVLREGNRLFLRLKISYLD